MIQLKEHTKEEALQQKIVELEKQLIKTKNQLQKETFYNKELEAIISNVTPSKKSKIITIKSATKIEFVNVADIVFCSADIGYTDIQLIDRKIITAAKPLNIFENILTEHAFFRISKSHLINPEHIVTFYKDRNEILLQGDIILPISRRRRVEFLKVL